jgi:hypothetical protein
MHQLELREYLLIGMQERLVAGQVKPPLDDRERLVSFQFVLGELNYQCELIERELIVLNEQRLAVREVLLLQLLEPWYFSLILI